jgi:UDP-N-acetylglucosamine diphosphorylase / glucose-1-phosphate thymidylyltransferase / UDP-N-acetylgalactosamine diphosphorylase / glucosamine-1-phosphate N-acetyltransferase / galactosamine-1-phosphate N-acetyltransferase
VDAVILAAGLGTRLRPHTLTTPKPMLPIQGRPILDWTIGALPSSVDRLLVVTHYLADQVVDYLKKQRHIRDWVQVSQGTPRGTGDAVRSCREFLHSDSVMVLNGDDLFGARDMAELARFPAGLIVHAVDEPRRFGIAFLKPDGTLDKLVEKPPLDGRQLANAGAYVFPRRIFDEELELSPRGEYEITDYVSRLAARGPVAVVEGKFWLPIGTEEIWQRAQSLDLASVMTRSD